MAVRLRRAAAELRISGRWPPQIAVDLLGGADAVTALENGVQMLPIDSIRPFRKHPFRLYEGDGLDDMVESIREHGVLVPVIVWQHSDGYEMLSGHNRQMAGQCRMGKIGCIVAKDLSRLGRNYGRMWRSRHWWSLYGCRHSFW